MEWRNVTGGRQDFTLASADPEKVGTETAPQVDSAEQQGHKGPYAEDASRRYPVFSLCYPLLTAYPATVSEASTKVDEAFSDRNHSGKPEIEQLEGQPVRDEQRDASGSTLTNAPTADDDDQSQHSEKLTSMISLDASSNVASQASITSGLSSVYDSSAHCPSGWVP